MAETPTEPDDATEESETPNRLAERVASLVAWWEASFIGAVLARLEPARPQVLVSAIAYNLFFALAPTLVALVAAVSLVGRDEQTLGELEETLVLVLPEAVATFVTTMITQVEQSIGGATATVVVVSMVIALWSGARASDILIASLATIEGIDDRRPWLMQRVVGMLATAGLALSLAAAGLLLAAGESITDLLGRFGLERIADLIAVLRVPVAGVVIGVFLWLFYRWAPPRPFPMSLLASVISMLGIGAASMGLRLAIGFGFGTSATFALIGSVAFLLLWLYVVGYVLVAAAAITTTLHDRRAGRATAPTTR